MSHRPAGAVGKRLAGRESLKNAGSRLLGLLSWACLNTKEKIFARCEKNGLQPSL